MYYWKQVLQETNNHASTLQIAPFTLKELMTFLGLLFYMAIVKKGELANYWGMQVEEAIFDTGSTSLDGFMKFHRFKLLRKAFNFRNPSSITPQEMEDDAAVRVRTLLNLLKLTGTKYVQVGREISVDEASVACRSKFGRHLIMYNPQKPSGKYHFRFYMSCCATSWIALTFRLHCASEMENRLQGLTTESEARSLADDWSDTLMVRQHVLEVSMPFFHSKRVINCDNYYMSVQLLDVLRVKGLYGRGTAKRSSKHFPGHVMLPDLTKAQTKALSAAAPRGSTTSSRDRQAFVHQQAARVEHAPTAPSVAPDPSTVVRGMSLQAVSEQHQILAASWCDGNIVRIVSNADASALSQVSRTIRGEKKVFSAPTAIKEYNQSMQGVDRHDQLRARFSLANGHSFKKWHKKLALALIDIARVNAFLTRQLAQQEPDGQRDAHRQFMMELTRDLLNGKWEQAPSSEHMLYDNDTASSGISDSPVNRQAPSPGSTPMRESTQGPKSPCTAVASQQMFGGPRRKRVCAVCRFEGRPPTQLTDFCSVHGVCLCKKVYAVTARGYGCQNPELTCWDKYHLYYYPAGLFTDQGNVKTSHEMYKAKRAVLHTNTQSLPSSIEPSTSVRTLSFEENPDDVVGFQEQEYALDASPRERSFDFAS